MTTSLTTTILCAACHKANEPDSRFCRYCGASLEGALVEGAPLAPADDDRAETLVEENADYSGKIEAHTPMLNSAVAAPIIAPALPAEKTNEKASDKANDEEALSSPAEFDARRARQLLDRSLHLSERGETGAAILACRQSIALAPTAPGGYSMLGLLLERMNNLPQAVAAYEKAVQFAPNSTMDRESVARLREKLNSQKSAVPFHFDDRELFGDAAVVATAAMAPGESPAPPSGTPEEPALNISAAAPGLPAQYQAAGAAPSPAPAAVPAAKDPYKPTLAQSLAAQLPAIKPGSTTEDDITERRSTDRRVEVIPVLTERRFRTERRTQSTAKKANIAPIFMGDVAPSDRRWDQLWRRPSYYARSLPLAGAHRLCLSFLLWARGYAVSRSVSEVVSNPSAPVADPMEQEAPANTNANAPATQNGLVPAPPLNGQAPGPGSTQSGFPISNRPATAPGQTGAQQPAAAPATGAPATGAPSRPASVPRSAGGQGSNPSMPQMIPPAPIPSSGSAGSGNKSGGGSSGANGSGNRGNNGLGGLGLPSPNIGSAAPPTVFENVNPIGSSPALNPAGDSGRGYTRITQGRIGFSSIPRRPAAQAGDAERDAANASRNGQSDRALGSLNSAINNDASDAGYRLQQRAMLFLDRGDYSNAADDFQAAITAYGQQVASGTNVAAAQAGLKAARNGLNLALAGKAKR